jgi:hypothetical protein
VWLPTGRLAMVYHTFCRETKTDIRNKTKQVQKDKTRSIISYTHGFTYNIDYAKIEIFEDKMQVVFSQATRAFRNNRKIQPASKN